MALILIDTDVLIDAGRSSAEALSSLEQARQRGQPALSAVTRMELMVGCRNKVELRVLDRFLRHFDVVSLDEMISENAVELLRTYRLSHGLLIADALIAATALSRSVPLVSKNQRDYRFIQHLDLLPYPKPFGQAVES